MQDVTAGCLDILIRAKPCTQLRNSPLPPACGLPQELVMAPVAVTLECKDVKISVGMDMSTKLNGLASGICQVVRSLSGCQAAVRLSGCQAVRALSGGA